MPTAFSRLNWLPAAGLLLLGTLGFAAAWILLGNYQNSLCTPMTVLAALDAVLLLYLAKMRGRTLRVALALLVTAGAALIAIGALISTRIGLQLGLLPWEAFQRLGMGSARLMLEMSLDRVDLAWLLAGLVIAVVLALR